MQNENTYPTLSEDRRLLMGLATAPDPTLFIGIYEGESLDGVFVSEDSVRKLAKDLTKWCNRVGEPRKCEECAVVYLPVRKDQRFHSTKCRNRYHQRDWRKRHNVGR